MFSINNLFTKLNTTVKAKYKTREIEFVISSVISKRNKDELDNDIQFTLLNAYLDHKGEEFKEELFEKLLAADEEIMMSITRQDIYPLPYSIIHPILDMFDMVDVFNFIKHTFKLKAPSNLMDEFDPLIESDGRGTRIQTYLKDDYLELATLSTILKATVGPICHFAYVKNKELNSIHREYILFHFYKSHKLYNTPPMQKLLGLVEKLVYLPTNGPDADSVRILEKQIPKDEIPIYVLGVVVLQKIAISPLVDDDENKNIITKIYNYINNKLKSSGDVSKSVRNKTALSDSEGAAGDRESIVESYRIISELSSGLSLEMDWAVSTIDRIIHQLPKHVSDMLDRNIVIEASQFCKAFHNGNIHRAQIDILAIIFKSLLDPRSLDYIKLESMVNLFSVGFAYLWAIDCKNLALLLTSQVDHNSADVMSINITVNRSRIPKEIKEELNTLFPYKRVINDNNQANLVEETVNELANEIFNMRWIPLAYDKYIVDVLGEKNIQKILPADLKVQLAEFIIKNERLR